MTSARNPEVKFRSAKSHLQAKNACKELLGRSWNDQNKIKNSCKIFFFWVLQFWILRSIDGVLYDHEEEEIVACNLDGLRINFPSDLY